MSEDITLENWRGDTAETAITNAMAFEKGFPALTEDGDLVSIVKVESHGASSRKTLVDSNGVVYEQNPVGDLVKIGEGADTTPVEEPTDVNDEARLADVQAQDPHFNGEKVVGTDPATGGLVTEGAVALDEHGQADLEQLAAEQDEHAHGA